jgi:hypothetical protein
VEGTVARQAARSQAENLLEAVIVDSVPGESLACTSDTLRMGVMPVTARM